jgi:hypothetical protein
MQQHKFLCFTRRIEGGMEGSREKKREIKIWEPETYEGLRTSAMTTLLIYFLQYATRRSNSGAMSSSLYPAIVQFRTPSSPPAYKWSPSGSLSRRQ